MNVKITKSFKKDRKQADKAFGSSQINDMLRVPLTLLSKGEELPEKYKDHQLVGPLKDFREIHLRPDLLLIYQISEDTLILLRLGSHSELFK